jgi:hypothetical protein
MKSRISPHQGFTDRWGVLHRSGMLCIAVVLCAMWSTAEAQSTSDSLPIPPGTNPADHAIFPADGQTEEQQLADQLGAYRWATQQTGWDPYQAYDKMAEQGYVAARTAESTEGAAIRGAAKGALVGLAIGAIAGDAGKGAAIGAAAGGMTGGMRGRRTREAAQSQSDQAVDEFNRGFANWDKFYVAFMEGNKYTVK